MNNKNIKIRINIDGILKIDKCRDKYNNATFQDKKVLKFIEKLSKDFAVALETSQNEIQAAKWLIDNNMACLVPYLLNEEKIFLIYINAECLAKCENFDKFYNGIKSLKTS